MALGAGRGGVLGLILRQGGLLVGLGAALGLVAALGLGHVAAGFLPGVSGADPLTFIAVTALLVAAGLAACLLPGLRATRVDPAVALRLE